MSAQVRFFMILIVIALSVALIWPNIGERTIRLYPNETLSETKRDEVLNNVFKYVNEHYKGKYTPEIRTGKPIDNPKGVQEKYLSITGKFVQAAFLNELGRIEGVDASRMALEPMWVERNLKAKPFKLGLDLQGGMNLVLEGDFEKVATRIKEVYPPEMIAELKRKKKQKKIQKRKSRLRQSWHR
ncbi:MAG TPA: hypothetical protein PLY93_08260 [Turneriella sp.]|nr:hypothetical protein [Turneriella sp.]